MGRVPPLPYFLRKKKMKRLFICFGKFEKLEKILANLGFYTEMGDRTKEERLLSLKKRHLVVFCIINNAKLCYDYV